TWFPDDWVPVAAAFTNEGRAVWVVSVDGSYSLIDCVVPRENVNSFDVGSEPCTQKVEVSGVPLLAGAEPGLGTM
ncbi:MAG: hypothetical protein ABIO16_03805, partial [Nocardioides sp.]